MNRKNYLSLFVLFFAMFTATLADAQCNSSTVYLSGTIYKCPDVPYNWHGHIIDTTGNYSDTIALSGGCDSINVQFFQNYTIGTPQIYDTICQGQSYTDANTGMVYTTTTTIVDTGFAQRGLVFCDSFLYIHLYVRPANNDTVNITATTCVSVGRGGTTGGYNFYGTTETTSGTYSHIVVGPNCADSVYVLHLTAITSSPFGNNQTITICTGGSYTINGHTYTTAGRYIDTLTSIIGGCDSIVNTTLTVGSQVRPATTTASLCSLTGSYTWMGHTYTSPCPAGRRGTTPCDSIVIPGVNGACDTVYTLTLTYAPVNAPAVNGTLCTGGTYYWRGHAYTTPSFGGGGFGGYKDTVLGTNGVCDSIFTLNLAASRTNPPSYTYADSFCYGTTYSYMGLNFTLAGVDTIYSGNVNGGCDTMHILTLTYRSAPTISIADSFCQGGMYVYNGTDTFRAAGTYPVAAHLAPFGCDTVVALTLTYRSAPTRTIVDSFCQGYSYSYAGSTFTTAGSHVVTVSSGATCDSVITLNLSYKTAPHDSAFGTLCTFGTWYHYDANDSFNRPGTYTITKRSTNGCDTIVTLIVSFGRGNNINFTDSFCQGSVYNFRNDTTFTAATGRGGFAYVVPSRTGGCDTTFNITLTYKSAPTVTVVDSFCQGARYHVADTTFTTAVGTPGRRPTYYSRTVPNQAGGCDSVYNILLTYKSAPTLPAFTDSFCQGTVYHFHNDTTTLAGRHSFTIPTTGGGCDTVVRVTLTYKSSPSISSISQTIIGGVTYLIANPFIAGAQYQWYFNGTAVSGQTSQNIAPAHSGTYTVDLTNGACSGSHQSYTYTSVGISDISSDMFRLYPNPTTGKFTIETEHYAGTDLIVYDIFGRVVLQKALSSAKESIDMSGAANGTYYVVMKNQFNTKYAHFVIAHQ
jgi:hypothetical protein